MNFPGTRYRNLIPYAEIQRYRFTDKIFTKIRSAGFEPDINWIIDQMMNNTSSYTGAYMGMGSKYLQSILHCKKKEM